MHEQIFAHSLAVTANMILTLMSFALLLASFASAGVHGPRDGSLFLSTFDDYQVPDQHVNRLDKPIDIVNGLNFSGMNYLSPVANGVDNTYVAPSSPNVAAVLDGTPAYMSAVYDGSTTASFDFQLFRWGCVVGSRTFQDDDPIEVTGMYTGCSLTLTAFKGLDQVAQQTFRYTTTRQTCSNCTTVALMSSFVSNQNFRKADTITFKATYPTAVDDTQLTALYLDDLHTINYART